MPNETDSAEITINYETLYDMLRKEKTRDELQQMDPSFYDHLVDYLKSKISLIEGSRNKHDLFSTTESSELSMQIGNIKRMVKEIFDRREKKIILMALNKSRTRSDIIDTSNLMTEEREFYGDILSCMDRFRKGVYERMMSGQRPMIEARCDKPAIVTTLEPKDEEPTETQLVRFLKSVPKFVGKELEVYGPFQEDDMANLPRDIAKVLISKGRAEEMQG